MADTSKLPVVLDTKVSAVCCCQHLLSKHSFSHVTSTAKNVISLLSVDVVLFWSVVCDLCPGQPIGSVFKDKGCTFNMETLIQIETSVTDY